MLATIESTQLADIHGGNLLTGTGRAVGFGAGVAVTAGLALSPKWSQHVPGQPPGFEKRHESVVGPKVTSYSNGLAPGAWKDFTSGVGAGATAAPGWSFRHGL
jgi:hypothetical protein